MPSLLVGGLLGDHLLTGGLSAAAVVPEPSAGVFGLFSSPIFSCPVSGPMSPNLGETITLDLPPLASPTTGASADATGLPTVVVREDGNDTPILTPTVVKRAGSTGEYFVPVACTTGNGFEAGKSYNVVALATVAGVTARAKLASFQVRQKVEADLDVPQALSIILAAVAGEGPGVVAGTGTYKNPAGTAARVAATVNGGNRSGIVLTPYTT